MKILKLVSSTISILLLSITILVYLASQGDIIALTILVFLAVIIVMILTAGILIIGMSQSAKITQSHFEKNAVENLQLLKSIQGVMGSQLNGLSKMQQFTPPSQIVVDNDVFDDF